MTTFHIRLAGPAAVALDGVTALADADGVDLTASAQPVPVGDGAVALDVTVEGDVADVDDAVAAIRAGLPSGATIQLVEG